MTTNVHLTPELERFARASVESGRYNSVSEVVRAALRLLADTEDRRLRLRAMLDDARDEADREGTHDVEEVAAELDEIIRNAR